MIKVKALKCNFSLAHEILEILQSSHKNLFIIKARNIDGSNLIDNKYMYFVFVLSQKSNN